MVSEYEGKYVYHVQTGACGRVARHHDGKADQYTSPVNNLAVAAPVLVLENGHAVLAPSPDSVVVLSDAEAAFFGAMQKLANGVLTEGVKIAAHSGIPLATATLLLVSTLRTQADILQAANSSAA